MNRYETYITTASGKQLHVFLSQPEEILAEDIATGLSNECRWGGQLNDFYSVAQHSLMVGYVAEQLAHKAGLSDAVARMIGLAGHLHDAAEGLGFRDLPTPIKRFLPDYAAAEHDLLWAVMSKFMPDASPDVMHGQARVSPANQMYVEPILHPLVWKADAIILATEDRDLRVKHACGVQGAWHPIEEPLKEEIVPYPPKVAKFEWLKRFHGLTEGKFTQ